MTKTQKRKRNKSVEDRLEVEVGVEQPGPQKRDVDPVEDQVLEDALEPRLADEDRAGEPPAADGAAVPAGGMTGAPAK